MRRLEPRSGGGSHYRVDLNLRNVDGLVANKYGSGSFGGGEQKAKAFSLRPRNLFVYEGCEVFTFLCAGNIVRVLIGVGRMELLT